MRSGWELRIRCGIEPGATSFEDFCALAHVFSHLILLQTLLSIYQVCDQPHWIGVGQSMGDQKRYQRDESIERTWIALRKNQCKAKLDAEGRGET